MYDLTEGYSPTYFTNKIHLYNARICVDGCDVIYDGDTCPVCSSKKGLRLEPILSDKPKFPIKKDDFVNKKRILDRELVHFIGPAIG